MTEAQFSSAPGQLPRRPRKNLLLAASVEAGALRVAVRIRNLSETGAMLDGATLPDPGTTFTLRRADVSMSATVVWIASGRCGVRFNDATISVDEWVTGTLIPSFLGHQGQARVDAIQTAVRSGAALPEAPKQAAPQSTSELETRITEEIVYVRRLLDELGEGLVEDPHVLQRHMQALQNLDRASQVLDHLGTILTSPDRVAAAEAVAMQDLRERLLRKT
ncbi:PilZ domain-containing protein [Sphingomonas sp. MMS12-HWE2-04]|uniref:PilZ domain-containing protein n=1 Tax=Sphingomonas sp. MMS12-HWE2-04 TaxID=3234199 RepID=UPI003850EE5C